MNSVSRVRIPSSLPNAKPEPLKLGFIYFRPRPLQNSLKSPKFSSKTFRGFLMSTFFQQTAQAMIAKHIDRFPLLK
ncbi:hypothetical protein, partial [Neisseria dentiae]|uniref:hypothetical protein n=1 Tax=Neisseria dentiae TaxID=194197 RepID=UPI0035A13A34